MPISARLQTVPLRQFGDMSNERDELLSLGFSEKELRRHLSPLWSLIVDLIGFDLALDLMDRFGGKQVYIPTTPERSTQLVRLLGHANLTKICDLWGTQKVVFPQGLTGATILTRLKGIRMLKDGKSLNAICKDLAVSRSTVSDWMTKFLSDEERTARAERPTDHATQRLETIKRAMKLVSSGVPVAAVAERFGVKPVTVKTWKREYTVGAK